MNPKHIDQVQDERRAVAPYNFVELPDTIVPAEPLPDKNCYHDYSEHKISQENTIKIQRHTGQIDCTITTSSPLYIRCGMTPTDFAKFGSKPDDELTDAEKEEKRNRLSSFFENPANLLPTIPGSSIRGMLRTIIEIISYSKIDKVADKKLIYRDFIHPSLQEAYRNRLLREEGDKRYSFLMQAGYIVSAGSGWAIQPAKKLVQGASFARIEKSQIKQLVQRRWHDIHNARQVTVHVDPINWHLHRGDFIELYYAKATPPWGHRDKSSGVLVKTGDMPKKKMECVIGLPDDSVKSMPIPDSMLQDYKEQITKKQKEEILENKEGVLKNMHPVFYLMEDDKLVFFGHTMMFRLPYHKSIQEFIPSCEYKTLSDYSYNSPLLDITDAIFGFAKDKKQKEEQTKAGRTFVSDAKCKKTADQNIWLTTNATKAITPKILASPKPTTFQHYLVQTSDKPEELKHYDSSPNETAIRGHKLYWHQGNVKQSQIEEGDTKEIEKAPSQYTDIKPIKENVSFDFTIWFENLSDVELGALLWLLNLANDDEYRLSLGMGKPLGMGAIKININCFSITNYQKQYNQLFHNGKWASAAYKADYIQAAKQQCLRNFEHYICQHIAPEFERLQDVPRIKTLLAMLRWTGVSENSSRYMEIERKQQPCIGKLGNNSKGTNEYKERPVLPTPLQVIKDDQEENYPGSSSSSSGGGSNPAAWQRPKRPR
ncbi:TIGR03986 family type III CRISPR-associated RAMP protein [Coleofasciculus sp. E1-EBD-02]|uniref:TIGR03986 family type III CRISPR-associated RAMP protein n=1 Tax=Coleofasciculus sp. E1-EBD-02 TaxID=3068481 RepID=UPI0032F84382